MSILVIIYLILLVVHLLSTVLPLPNRQAPGPLWVVVLVLLIVLLLQAAGRL